MESTILVSIGLPVYNGERWLAQTIDSVLAQTWSNLELVIADNASTDGTEALCKTYVAKDSRVRYHRNPENIGLSNNFNRAFELSRGKYFKWTSCSDTIAPNFVEKCVDVLEQRLEVILVYPGTCLFETNPNDGVSSRDSFNLDIESAYDRFVRYVREVKLNNIMHGVYRSDKLRATRGYNKFVGADYNLLAEYVLLGRVVQLPDVLLFRRMTPETFTGYLSYQKGVELYDPNKGGELAFHELIKALDFFVIAVRAPVGIKDRLRLVAFSARLAYWNRRTLIGEFAAGLRALIPSSLMR